MPDHSYFANLIWQIADLLRGPYRPPQYERVMLPMTVLLSAQTADGSWPPEVGLNTRLFGNSYTTAMAVLSLTPPYQLLPVYQR